MNIFISKLILSYLIFIIILFFYQSDFKFSELPLLSLKIFGFLTIWNMNGLLFKLIKKIFKKQDHKKLK